MHKFFLLALAAATKAQVSVGDDGQEIDNSNPQFELGQGNAQVPPPQGAQQEQEPVVVVEQTQNGGQGGGQQQQQPQQQQPSQGSNNQDTDNANNQNNNSNNNDDDDQQDPTPTDDTDNTETDTPTDDADQPEETEEQSLEELVNQTLQDLEQMTPEERETFFNEFASTQDFEINFGFNGGDPQCAETVQTEDEYCPNYAGLSTIAESDDIPTLLLLIEQTCTSESTTPLNGLGPLLCLGAVGSCEASSLGWSLPEDNTKGSFENFFNNVRLGEMTAFGEENGKSTLCYKDCRSAWEFWADCGNFQLEKENDPCEGLPETGCYDPSRPETATLEGANSAGQVFAGMGLVMAVVALMM